MRKISHLEILRNFRIAIMMLVLMFFVTSLWAQQSSNQDKISGTVKDEQGLLMPGVSIRVVGSNQGTITDKNGLYSINITTSEAFFEFSFIGYETQIISVGTKSVINVQLSPTEFALNEIVVVGYGTQRAKDLTGNISWVSAKDFEKAPLTNAEGLIANKISGVQVLPLSGRPGAGSSFLIRGGSSLSASNDPLIVIDNVPIEGWNGGPGMLSQLNPNDIESFTVLKDASAAAIYGSRASNGVILITTKKGSKGKMKIDFSSNVRMSTLREQTPVLTADQYRSVIADLGRSSIVPGTANTNWQSEIFQDALAHDYNVSVSGAVKLLPYRISVGYVNQDGILRTGNYERTTAAINLNPTFLKNSLKLNINLKGSYENENIANQSAIWTATAYDPTQPVRVDDQTYGGYFQYLQFATNPGLTIINPVSMLEQVNSKRKSYRSLGNFQADYSMFFLPDLHINVNAGYDISSAESSYFAPVNYFPANIGGGSLYTAKPSRETINTLFESYLFYSKELPSINSRFDITTGYSYNNFETTIYNYPSYNAASILVENSVPIYAFDKPSHSIISFYGRINYALNGKYLLTASLRDDASSRFAKAHRWGLFPSVAMAWKIDEESFLKNSNAISSLKMRLGYGITGQQDGLANYYPIPRYITSSLNYNYSIGNTSYTTVWPQVYNPDLKWEETATANVGIDYGFLEHRITGSVDVYRKDTKDLLNEITIPYGLSFGSTMVQNIGSMVNNGIEFNIKAIAIESKDFNWELSFNATYNENKITKISIDNGEGVGLFSDAILVNTLGQARRTFYLYRQVYDEQGMPIEDQMLDVNGDGLTNANDRYVTGKSSLPKYMFGFNTNFQYKKWSAGTSLHANIGHYIFYKPLDNSIAITGWSTSRNLSTMYFDSKFSNANQYQDYSDYYLQNASFLKMDNVYLGYDFGKIIPSQNIRMKVNASVQNVFTLTKFTGLDPESNRGSENAYPVPRVFAFGLTVNF